jgi:shikimate dehydrogenase
LINGRTELIVHLGYPTKTFTAPMIYNPWFESRGINAVVVPMGAQSENYPALFRPLFRLSNVRGALVTMPHKVTTVSLLDEAAVAVQVAGSCNAILRRPDGSLYGDLFDGIGFVRGAKRKGFNFSRADCLIVGTGGVGSAIAAEDPGSIALFDIDVASAERLAARMRRRFPGLAVGSRDNDPAGYRLVVNATPLGMAADDPVPFDPARLDADAFVGDVVLTAELTPLLKLAAQRGCQYLIGTDMLFEQIPAYLEFFGYGTATPDELRATSRISY